MYEDYIDRVYQHAEIIQLKAEVRRLQIRIVELEEQLAGKNNAEERRNVEALVCKVD